MTKPKFEFIPTITMGNVITFTMVAITAIWWGAGIDGRVTANAKENVDQKVVLKEHKVDNNRQYDALTRTISDGFREQKQDTKALSRRIDKIVDGG